MDLDLSNSQSESSAPPSQPKSPEQPNLEQSTSSQKDEPKKKIAIFIERKSEKTPNELKISYDTSILEKTINNEEQLSNLMKLIKKILLSCNISYFIYATNKIFNSLKSLFAYNIIYFIAINILLNFLYKNKSDEKNYSILSALILFNIPELLIIFFYRKKILGKIGRSIVLLYSYLNERIIYIYNKDPNNKYVCHIDQKTYNLFILEKDNTQEEKEKNLYYTDEKLLAKDTFFDSVIAYSNANFGDFDFNNLTEKEEAMFQDIFELINNIEKKIKDDNSLLSTVATLMGNISYNNASKFNVLYALGLKLGSFLIDDIYLNQYAKRSSRNKLIEEKTKEFNQKHMEEGYFLALNEHVILLFRIKENYKSFDESYNILYNESQNLFKKFFGQ